MAEVLEEPERARRPDAGLEVVDDHGAIREHAPEFEDVVDHPQEGPERGRIGVDEAVAPQVDVGRSREVAASEVRRRPAIEQQRGLRARDGVPDEFRGQRLRRDEQVGAGVALRVR